MKRKRPKGMKQFEIAKAMGVSRQAVENIEKRALRKIRERLGRDPEIRAWLEGLKSEC